MTTATIPDIFAMVKSKNLGIRKILDVEKSIDLTTFFLLAEYDDDCQGVITITQLNPNLVILHSEVELRHVQRSCTRGNTSVRIWPTKEFGSLLPSTGCDRHISLVWRSQI